MSLTSAGRLAALERSGLLNRSTAEQFNSLVYATGSLVSADACMVNALTADQQVCVASWPPALGPPTCPAEDSACVIVVESGRTLVVPDTTEHVVLCTRPWVEIYRGYLAAPVCFNGQAVGALCALTSRPRVWSSHDVRGIEAMAELVSAALTGA